MPLSQTDQVPLRPIDLVFIRDFKEALDIVKGVLGTHRGFFFIFSGLSLAQTAAAVATTHSFQIVDWMMEAATLFVASTVITSAYKKLMPDFDTAQVQDKSEKRIISASVRYGLITGFLGLFFLLPGIWFAASSCLASICACLENCNAGDSIKRSHALVKGHFMTALSYAVFKPFLVWAAMVSIYIALVFGCNYLLPDLENYVLPVAEGAMTFFTAIFQLAIFALLVRLYARLKGPEVSLVSPVVPSSSLPHNGATTPTKLHEIDDSKLNPRW